MDVVLNAAKILLIIVTVRVFIIILTRITVGRLTPDISIYFPTKLGGVSRKTPNCELCYFKNPELAENCLKHLCLLHSSCHNDLHHDR